jgi:hypothetical protein
MQTIIGNAFAAQVEMGITPLKEVWVNETNARPSSDPEWPVQVELFPLDLEQQAWYIPQAFALGFYAGAARMGIYKLVDVNMAPGDESWGLIRPYDFSRRPAYYAYQNTIKYLSGFTYPVRREMGSNYFIVSFNRPQGAAPAQAGVTRVMWARYGTAVPLRVPALAESAQLVNVMGEVEEITAVDGAYDITLEAARCAGECLIGGPPLFLVEEGVVSEPGPTAQPISQPAFTPTATTEITGTAVLTPTMTLTATAVLTETATPTLIPSPDPTNTSEPTETATVPLTNTTMATAVAVVVENAATPTPQIVIASDDRPTPKTSWLFLGAGLGLGIILLVYGRRRQG